MKLDNNDTERIHKKYKQMIFKKISSIILSALTILSCNKDDYTVAATTDCTSDIVKDTSVSSCTETLTFIHQ
jgi:hypothetical protein